METINGETARFRIGNTRSNSINLKHLNNISLKIGSSVETFANLQTVTQGSKAVFKIN